MPDSFNTLANKKQQRTRLPRERAHVERVGERETAPELNGGTIHEHEALELEQKRVRESREVVPPVRRHVARGHARRQFGVPPLQVSY